MKISVLSFRYLSDGYSPSINVFMAFVTQVFKNFSYVWNFVNCFMLLIHTITLKAVPVALNAIEYIVSFERSMVLLASKLFLFKQ